MKTGILFLFRALRKLHEGSLTALVVKYAQEKYSSVLLFSAKVEARHQGAGGGVAAVRGGAAAAGGAGQRAGRAGRQGGQGQAGAADQAPVTPGGHRRHQDRAAVPGAVQLQ